MGISSFDLLAWSTICRTASALAVIAAMLLGGPALAVEEETAVEDPAEQASRQLYESIPWTTGPATVPLGDSATLEVPSGFKFTGPAGTASYMQWTENTPNPSEIGVLTPEHNELWFIVFSFDPIGYVKDDEKEALNPKTHQEMLKAITEGTAAGNAQRQQMGWPALHIDGWHQAPFYDSVTNKLTWATRVRSDDSISVNYDSRALGRHGVMNVTMVASPELVSKITRPTRRSSTPSPSTPATNTPKCARATRSLSTGWWAW